MFHYEIKYNNEIMTANSKEELTAYTNVLKDIDVQYAVDECFLVATVQFPFSQKAYTYLTDKPFKLGDYAVVETTDYVHGAEVTCLKVVQVIHCGYRTKADLEKVLPFGKYRTIRGEVKLA